MRSKIHLMFSLMLAAISIAGATQQQDATGSIPVFFTASDSAAMGHPLYVGHALGVSATLEAKSIQFTMRGATIAERFPGSLTPASVTPDGVFPAKLNAITGSPSNWRIGQRMIEKIRYKQLYPGIDMVVGGSGRLFKSEFFAAPGSDPTLIRIAYEGATSVAIDIEGNLLLKTGSGIIREMRPLAFQVIDGAYCQVPAEFAIDSTGVVSFALGDYDHSRELVIDPVINFSTYFGGSGIDSITGVAVDSSGNVYVCGYTDSLDFPLTGAYQGSMKGNVDAFVAKFDPTGRTLLYATYLGGSGDDRALAIAVDSSGQAVIAGATSSSNFPIVNGTYRTLAGGHDAFVARLSSNGSLLQFSTFFGGSGEDSANGIALDASRNIYIAGQTTSTNLPTLAAYQNKNAGRQDGFVAKFNSSGILQFSTYLGGIGDDAINGIAVDSAGSAYVAGGTTSPNFPISLGVLQSTNGGGQDAFVTKLSATGASLVYSTYLGGSGGVASLPEQANAIAVDSSGYAYIAGVTSSANFPVVNAFQSAPGGGGVDAFIAKVNQVGSALTFSTYLGGIARETATAIAVNSAGSVFVTGNTYSKDFPVVAPTQASFGGIYDAFVVQLVPAGNGMAFSTLYGGTSSDGGTAIAADANGTIWFAGQTTSTDFPRVTPYQNYGFSEGNGFVAKLSYLPKAAISTPTSPSTFTGPSVTFTWTDAKAAAYRLDVGSTPGGSDLFTQTVGSATTQLVSGLPQDGRTIYVRLWTYLNGAWQYNDYTYTAFAMPQATMSSPAPGSVLTGTAATFTWTNVNATAYRLDIGSGVAQTDIFTQTLGSVTQQAVTGLPQDGRTLYVRLWTLTNGNWVFKDYTYTAYTLLVASMVSPAPGSVLSGAAATFTWTDAKAPSYRIDIGTAVGKTDLYTATLASVTQQSVTGLPQDGRIIYVRLWTLANGTWTSKDYTYTTYTLLIAAMLTPAPGSTLTSTAATFTWTDARTTSYRVDIGTAVGKTDISTQTLGSVTQLAVTGLPQDGRALYVRLWTLANGTWVYNDYAYTAWSSAVAATMVAPAPNTTFTSASVTFSWSDARASSYRIDVGSAAGLSDIVTQTFGSVTQGTVAGLAQDGRALYVRLSTLVNGVWLYYDYKYMAYTAPANIGAKLTSPTIGTLLGSSATFAWTYVGATSYYLDVGTAVNTGNIFTGSVGVSTSKVVSGLPTNGNPIYVRVWSCIRNIWYTNNYVFLSTGTLPKATMVSPASGSKLTGTSVTFTWNSTGAVQYQLDVGTSLGMNNVFSTNTGTGISATVTNIPAGAAVYVRLWTYISGAWQYNDYTYTGP